MALSTFLKTLGWYVFPGKYERLWPVFKKLHVLLFLFCCYLLLSSINSLCILDIYPLTFMMFTMPNLLLDILKTPSIYLCPIWRFLLKSPFLVLLVGSRHFSPSLASTLFLYSCSVKNLLSLQHTGSHREAAVSLLCVPVKAQLATPAQTCFWALYSALLLCLHPSFNLIKQVCRTVRNQEWDTSSFILSQKWLGYFSPFVVSLW